MLLTFILSDFFGDQAAMDGVRAMCAGYEAKSAICRCDGAIEVILERAISCNVYAISRGHLCCDADLIPLTTFRVVGIMVLRK